MKGIMHQGLDLSLQEGMSGVSRVQLCFPVQEQPGDHGQDGLG